jgi:Zn-dependent protease
MGLGIGLFVGSLFFSTSGALAIQAFIWTTGSLVILVVAHELGHALAARVFSVRVNAILIANIGGMCLMGNVFPSPLALLVISASGILMQMVIFVLALAYLSVYGAPTTLPLKCVTIVFTGGNALMVVLNLLPFGARDGARMVQGLRAMLLGR